MFSAWWISGRERPEDFRPIGMVPTLTASNDTVSSFRNATIMHRFASRAFWQTLSSDIFAGQIIASLIVLIFVAVFLLREWISQNARPGVFEEDEIAGVPPQEPPVPNPPPANQQPVQDVNLLAPQRQGPLDGDVEARRQARLWRPHRPIPQNPRFEAPQRHFDDVERLELLREPIRRPQIAPVDPPLVPPSPVVLPPENLDTPPVDTSKGKEKEAVTEDSAPTASDVRRRMRMRFDEGDENTELPTQADSSLSVTSSFDPSPSLLGSVSGCSTAIESAPFEFTFRVLPNEDAEVDIREPVPEIPARSLVALQTALMTGTPIPEEEELPRRRSIVFSPELSPQTPSRAATPVVDDESDLKPLHDLSYSDLSFSRLSVPNSSLAAEDSLASSSLQHATPEERFTAQSIFTYPSEVSETDSTSMPAGNMDRKKRMRDEMEEEFEHYFRDPQPATLNPVDADNERIDVPREVPHRIEHAHIADREERHLLEVGTDEDDESEDDEAPEHIFWDADADRDEEDEEEEDPAEIGDFNIPNRQGAQAQPQPQAPAEQLNDAVEDMEAAVEDDMEGALEGRLTPHD